MRRWRGAAVGAAALWGCVPTRTPLPPPAPPPDSIVPAPVAAAPAGPIVLDGSARQGGALLGFAPPGTVSLRLDDLAVPVASDGRFLLAFDRDATPSARLVARLADGREVARTLAVAPGAWAIERIDAPLTAGKTSEEFARLRPAELEQIAAARARGSDAEGWRQRFGWPAEGRRSGKFGAQRIYQGVPASYHTGADVAVPPGTPVRAPADGVVVLAADHPFTLEGNLVILDHGMGLSSAFLHLSRIDVRVGDTVRKGDVLGRSGATGRATGPHLHWGVTWRGRRLDPALLAAE